MLRLRKKGKSNVDIAKEVELSDPYTDSALVVPLIKILLNDDAEDVLESYQNNKHIRKKQMKNNLKKAKINKKVKTCLLCDKEFIEPKNVSGQKYCPTCKSKYKDTEIRVLLGKKEGRYNVYTATEAYRLKKRGLTNKEIGNRLDIPSPLITSLIELLLPNNLDNGSNKDKKSKPIIDGDDKGSKEDKKSKVITDEDGHKYCSICDKKIPNTSNSKYCGECNKKYTFWERVVKEGIKDGTYDKELATQINDLIEKGHNTEQIAKKLKLPTRLVVKPIHKFLYEAQSNFKTCSVCGNKLIIPKGVTGKKYCDECVKKYDNNQRIVLTGINEGKYDRGFAIKLKGLLDEGLTKKKAAKKLKLHNPSLINPILEYLYYGDVKPIGDTKGPDNSSLINEDDLSSIDLNNYLILTDNGNESNILLKGTISGKNRKPLFNCLSGNGINVNDMRFTKKEDKTFEVTIDLDVDRNYADILIFELKILGFE